MADEELGRGWRYQQGPKTEKLKWESVEEKCVTQSTEAVSVPVAVLMESLQFCHVPDEYHFHTSLAGMLRLCHMASSASTNFFWTRDVGVWLWGLWLMRLRVIEDLFSILLHIL